MLICRGPKVKIQKNGITQKSFVLETKKNKKSILPLKRFFFPNFINSRFIFPPLTQSSYDLNLSGTQLEHVFCSFKPSPLHSFIPFFHLKRLKRKKKKKKKMKWDAAQLKPH